MVRALAFTFFPHPGHVRPSVGGLGGWDKVEGVRQGAQGAAPSLNSLPGVSLEPPWSLPGASLEPPWSLPGASLELKTQREGRDVRSVFLGQLHNHCLPMRRGNSVGKGVGKGVWGRGCEEGGGHATQI